MASQSPFDPSDVAAVEIATNGTSMRLAFTGQRWEIATKNDYPVKLGMVGELIQRLAKAKVLYERRA